MQVDSPLSIAIGWALSDLRTGDPFGLIHHGTCVRQPTHVLYGHQHVAGILQDQNGFVMRNAPEAPAIDIQNLIPNLQKKSKREKLEDAETLKISHETQTQ